MLQDVVRLSDHGTEAFLEARAIKETVVGYNKTQQLRATTCR
jgi:hypothetical protein